MYGGCVLLDHPLLWSVDIKETGLLTSGVGKPNPRRSGIDGLQNGRHPDCTTDRRPAARILNCLAIYPYVHYKT